MLIYFNIRSLENNILQGTVSVVGVNWLNRGQVWKALVAREADQAGEMPEGSVLVLKDGDISIPAETISKTVAVVVEQNDRNSHIVQLCSNNLDPQGQKAPIPCVVNLVGLFDWVKFHLPI